MKNETQRLGNFIADIICQERSKNMKIVQCQKCKSLFGQSLDDASFGDDSSSLCDICRDIEHNISSTNSKINEANTEKGTSQAKNSDDPTANSRYFIVFRSVRGDKCR